MSDSTSRKNLWDDAGKAGLILGAISIAYTVLQQPILDIAPKIGPVLTFLINTLMWAGKFIGCIFLMKFFMRRHVSGIEAGAQKEANAFGVATALTSALIVAAFSLAYSKFINPEAIQAAIDTAMSTYGTMLDSNSLEAIEQLKDKMPVISFFTNLLYCFIYGTVLSAILSRSFNKMNNPFDEQ